MSDFHRKGSVAVLNLFVIFFCFQVSLKAAWFDNLPYTVVQPDGSIIECYVSGDEFHNWLHDENGFTIIVGDDGFYYYAILQDDFPVASGYMVNSVDPFLVGLEPRVNISAEHYRKIKNEFLSHITKGVTAPHTGDMNSLVVYIRFSDQTEFTTPRTVYDARFNDPVNASQKHYFYEVSYGNLVIESHHYPICDLTTNLSYQDSHPRAYYEEYHPVNNPIGYQNNTQRTNREHTLLANAIAFIAPEVPADMNIDADNDGLVDNVCFIIRGGNGAWASLLWAHRWVLYSQEVFIHGKRVWDYTFQPESQNDTYTLCHEMFHVLGAPDLYRYYNSTITPVGSWDLMASGFVHMGAFMKWKYANQKWITDIPEITTAGTYTLNPLTSPDNNAYRIPSPNSNHEYFIVEYRKKEGVYEMNVPGEGLLVYRIDPSAGDGNAGGPPDEVYIYRPNGTPNINGSLGMAHFTATLNRTAINDETNPSSFLQNGSPGGLNIFNITAAGNTISFDILMGYEVFADFEVSATTVPAGNPVNFTDLSTNDPISWEWFFEGGTPAYSNEQYPQVQYLNNGMYDVTLIAANDKSVDTLTRTDLIIVGTPVAEVQPLIFNLTLEPNTTHSDSFTIANQGDTWLRYDLQQEYSLSNNAEVGTVMQTYSGMPNGHSGMTWANGQLYIVSMSQGTLSIYDTLTASITHSYNIHSSPFSIAYDGEMLWIGNNSGVVQSYYLDGTPGESAFNLPTSEIYTLAWDGESFLTNLVGMNNPFIHRLDPEGNIVQTLETNVEGRITQLAWVPQHTLGPLWANGTGKIRHLKETNDAFMLIGEFNSPANLSYSLSHDGTDLWWTALSGALYQIEDGLPEWVYINWNERLLSAGLVHEVPFVVNTKGMAEELHTASIFVQSNDPQQPEIEIVLNITVSTSTGIVLPEPSQSVIRTFNGVVTVLVSDPGQTIIEIYDLSGRIVKTVTTGGSNEIQVKGLHRNAVYLFRVTTNGQTSNHKVVLN